MYVNRSDALNHQHHHLFSHLILKLEGSIKDISLSLTPSAGGKTFQNLRVSSPAPVTMFSPSGLNAR